MSNDVHNESLKKKKKIYNQSLTELNTYTAEKTCEKNIEQNITDSYSRKNVSQKEKSEINALVGISLSNNCGLDNENVLTKKPKEKKNHNTSLNSIEINTNNDVDYRTYEKNNEHSISDTESTKNITKKMSEVNALTTKRPKKKKKHSGSLNTTTEAAIKSFKRTLVETNEQNIKDSDISDNVKKLKNKKTYIESLNLIELNTINDTEIKSLDRTCEEVNQQNIDSYSRKNVSRKRKSEINGLSNISLGDNCSIDNESIPIKKTKKKKNHDGSSNLIEFNTNNDTTIQILEKTYEEVSDQNINNFDFLKDVNQTIKSELNPSSENKYSMDYVNVAINKPKKKKKLDKSLDLRKLNTNSDVVNDSDFTKNMSQKIMSEINALPSKKPKKKKNHNKSLNSIELDTVNHDTETQIFERTYDQGTNDSDYRDNVNQIIKSELNTSSENKCSMDCDNVTKKPKKKKNHNTSLNLIEINTNNDTVNDSDFTKNMSQKIMSEINALPSKKPKKKKNHNKSLNSIELDTVNHDTETQIFERTYDQGTNDSNYRNNVNQIVKSELNTSSKNKSILDCGNVITKKPKRKKNHNTSLNSIELSEINALPIKKPKMKKIHDAETQIFEKTYEEVYNLNTNDSDYRDNVNQIIKSELNTSSENKCSMDCDNVTKKPKKKKNHNTSLNLIEINTNNDTVNDSDFTKNMSQKIMSEINALPFKKPKKKKNHTKSLNSIELDTVNHDTETQIFERTYEEVYDQGTNDSDYRDNVNQLIKSELNASSDISLGNKCSMDSDNVVTKKPKKKKNHNTSLNSIEISTNNDSHYRTYEKDSEHDINNFDSTKNIIQKRMSEINALADTSLGNDFSNDNENLPTKISKKKNNHNISLNSIDINTNHDTEIKTYEKPCTDVSEPNMNGSDTKALASASLKINYNLDSENHATKEAEKRKKHDSYKITNDLSMHMVSQNQSKLKTLLNSMDLYDFEESSTNNNTNFNLKNFNLVKYLVNKDPSLKHHPNFKQIHADLSKKIKLTINKKCELGPSDILLLKTVGKIILNKIVEKIDSAQDIQDLVIKLPPECMENKIHFIETTLSRLPNKSKIDIIKKQNPLIKLRVFNKDEDNMIQKYWSKFQKEYNISNILPFLSNGLEMTLGPLERLQFIRYISAGLPNRLLYSVFNRFNILFNEYQDKVCFSEEEDQLIMKVDKCDAIKNKFSVLSLILNRTRLQLYRRHEVLKNRHVECKKFVWDNEKRQELFTNILLETNTEHWTHLKNRTITKDVLIKIAKNLGENITYNKVRYQWNYLYTMLFCEKPILMSTFNLNMLELIEDINPEHWSDLNWIEITNKLYPGAKSKVICSFFHSWIDKKVPSKIKNNVRDTLDYLKLHEVDKLQARINKRGEREFPRLIVKDYDLLVNNQ